MADADWKPAFDVHFTDNGNVIYCENVEIREQVETFETTNTESAGNYEEGAGVTRYDIRGTALIDRAAVKMPSFKTLVPMVFSDGIGSFSGKGRIKSRTRQGGGKGGYKVPFEGTFSGVVTVS